MRAPETMRPLGDRQRRIYGPHGRTIGFVTATRSEWEGALLAECERGHIYLLPRDVTAWLWIEPGCPRCRVLGHR
jgi:hypothetical protein